MASEAVPRLSYTGAPSGVADEASLWTAPVEAAFLEALDRYMPSGPSKAFLLLSMGAFVHREVGVSLSADEISRHLAALYDPVTVDSGGDQSLRTSRGDFRLPDWVRADFPDLAGAAGSGGGGGGGGTSSTPSTPGMSPRVPTARRASRSGAATPSAAASPPVTPSLSGSKRGVPLDDPTTLEKLRVKRRKLEQTHERVKKTKKAVYQAVIEFVYASVAAQGGTATLSEMFDWQGKNWSKLEPKIAEKYAGCDDNKYRAVVRGSLYTNPCFRKMENPPAWTIDHVPM